MSAHAVYDGNLELRLENEIGSGGEARVWAIERNPSLCVKLYSQPTQEKLDKLNAMIRNAPDYRSISPTRPAIAWPQAIVWNERGEFVGFTMPRVDSTRPLHQIVNPSTRRNVIGGFKLSHLVQVASNLALCVSKIHERGYVMGDLNDSNILVGNDATVTIVDCDSFQVKSTNVLGETITHRCRVGRPEFTPPELLDKDLAAVDRRIEHDCFALAVTLFQLLMGGQHPFSIVNPPPEASSPEGQIRLGTFPFAVTRSGGNMCSIPYKIHKNCLHEKVWDQFQIAFDQGWSRPEVRPSAQEWLEVFKRIREEIRDCSAEIEKKQLCSGEHWVARPCLECQNRVLKANGSLAEPRRKREPAQDSRAGRSGSSYSLVTWTGIAPPGAAGPSIFDATPRSIDALPHFLNEQIRTLVHVAYTFKDSANSLIRVSRQNVNRESFVDVREYRRQGDVLEPANDGLCLPLTILPDLIFAATAAALQPYHFILPIGNLQIAQVAANGGSVIDFRVFVNGSPTDNGFAIATRNVMELVTGFEELRKAARV